MGRGGVCSPWKDRFCFGHVLAMFGLLMCDDVCVCVFVFVTCSLMCFNNLLNLLQYILDTAYQEMFAPRQDLFCVLSSPSNGRSIRRSGRSWVRSRVPRCDSV